MTKKKDFTSPLNSPVMTNMYEDQEEEGHKKMKKKKRKSESQETETENSSILLSPSVASTSSLSPPTKKKKKKKDKEEESEKRMINGIEENEQIVEGKTKKKKKSLEEMELPTNIEGKNMPRMEGEKPRGKRKSKVQEEEEELEDSPRKVEKKKSKKKEEKEVLSTSKKKKKKKKDEEEVDEEELKEDEDDGWSEELTLELLNAVQSQIPKQDSRTSRHTLARIDWNKVTIPGRSTEECQEHFMELYKKISTFKTLTTMIGEMEQMVTSGYNDARMRPMAPLNRFLKAYFTPEVKEDIKRKGGNMLVIAINAWKNLPKEEKDEYKREYEAQCCRMKQRQEIKESQAARQPRCPYQFCNVEDTGGIKLRNKYYVSLSPSEKVPYIRQALEEAMTYAAENNTDADPDSKSQQLPSRTIKKAELKLYLDECGYPEAPPTQPVSMFYRDNVHQGKYEDIHNKKLMELKADYSHLSDEEKNYYKKKVGEELLQFKKDCKEWERHQDEMTLYALQLYREMKPLRIPRQVKEQTPSMQQQIDAAFPHRAPANMTCPKFLNEPSKPLPTASKLFATKFKASADKSLSKEDLQLMIREGWKTLTDEDRNAYKTRLNSFHKLYEEELKKYVKSMDTETRIVYLGFNRVPLFKFFKGRDIFADDYPNSPQCPILVKGLQDTHPESITQSTIPPISPLNIKTSPPSSADEDEIMSLWPSPIPKKRKLSPMLFSSLQNQPSSPPSPTKAKKSKNHSVPKDLPATQSKQEVGIKNKKTSSTKTKKNLAVDSGKKKNKLPPSPPEEEEEESDDEENVVTSSWRSGPPKTPPNTSTSNKSKKNLAVDSGKKGKKPPPSPPKEEEEESEEEEEDVVIPSWRFGPPKTPPNTSTSNKSKKSPGGRGGMAASGAHSKKGKAAQPTPQESEEEEDSEEEEEEVSPAWRTVVTKSSPIASPTKKTQQQKKKQQQQQQKQKVESSSSGYSDSDSSD